MPGSPSSSWAIYRARLKSVFDDADPRVCAAFWLFGLINNVLYVIILSAALDLVGPSVPKGVVLLADVIPSFLTKLVAPYFIHKVPYHVRILVFVALSACGMLLIALTPVSKDGRSIAVKMVGVILASLSSGGGELSFLSLTHFYGHFSLAAWGSGTGGAGLIGAGAYVVATTSLGLSVRTSLLAFSFLPVIMLISFFIILPRSALNRREGKLAEYESMEEDEPSELSHESTDEDGISAQHQESEGLLSTSMHSASGRSFTSINNNHSPKSGAWGSLKANLARSRGLFFPYMLPLLLVYVAEYTINQGVAPTLLFPISSSPFQHYRSFYPTYNAIYQVGVFLSRSSTPFIRIHHLYLPSLLQVINLVILTSQALFNFIPSFYIICAIVFWEGVLGGLVYVSTFAEITDNVPKSDREFSLGATSVSDSGGICIAGFVGMIFEVWLCNWQVRHGRNYCKQL
ncbi:batten's disease protein Cln3 [Lepidopterella palustris CBS 459.81]|uniref:Protein BTN n=1 Tax=Lepidopterella palustris CBS 459.81 TaxID=1314670 RepID=A0A8E2EBB7_9PEZI|nr:batten's disease protein Cln3 [Lepidopterella palustris CBS 459.81]